MSISSPELLPQVELLAWCTLQHVHRGAFFAPVGSASRYSDSFSKCHCVRLHWVL